jgi:hypothetical protein
MRFVLLIAGLILASQANATIYQAELRGYLSQQLDLSFDDPLMSLGEPIVLKAQFSSDRVYDEFEQPNSPGESGYFVTYAHMGGLGPSGSEFFRIDTNNFTWSGYDDRIGGYAMPWMTFDLGKITGLYGSLLESDSSAKPGIDLHGTDAYVVAGHNVDLNNYVSPGFKITWDFASSSVSAVPEPSSWLLMIGGAGMIGVALRRKRRRHHEECSVKA